MKAIILTIALATSSLLLGGCSTTRNNNYDFVIPAREDLSPSWRAFCSSRNYDVATQDSEIVNEYLDTWCGSVEEEQALKL